MKTLGSLNRKVRTISRLLFLTAILLFSTSAMAAGGTFTVLHSFGTQPDNGRIPYGVLTLHEGLLYGTTTYGGPPYDLTPPTDENKGDVFRMNLDGSGFTILHEFTAGAADGWKPWSGLAISGSTIYGSTVYGGPYAKTGGVLYKMQTDGTSFSLLHTFGAAGDGYGASTSPALIGDTLYGLTRWGGDGAGTIYSYNIVQGLYSQLHRFRADGSEGSFPLGSITAGADGFLYGLAWQGGQYGMGTLFRLKPDGSSFQVMHHFAGGTGGMCPYDSLAFDGGHTLYGTTLGNYGVIASIQAQGLRWDPLLFGSDPVLAAAPASPCPNAGSDKGTVFKYDSLGMTYSVLHRFAGGASDSVKPNGSVVFSGDGLQLYGTTHGDAAWGGSEAGILYRMNIDGSAFQQLYQFSGGMAGNTPMRTPLLIDGKLYGMTAYGGAEDYGLIYRYEPASAGDTLKMSFRSAAGYDGWILESGEASGQGGLLDKGSTTFNVGDNAKDKQYRGILSFNTSGLPEDAAIVSAALRIKPQAIIGKDPFGTLGPLLGEIRTGGFSSDPTLQLSDFSASPSAGSTQFRLLSRTTGWYAVRLGTVNLGFINRSGITQFRLHFSLDDDDDLVADYVRFYSGDVSDASYRPVLVVEYTVP